MQSNLNSEQTRPLTSCSPMLLQKLLFQKSTPPFLWQRLTPPFVWQSISPSTVSPIWVGVKFKGHKDKMCSLRGREGGCLKQLDFTLFFLLLLPSCPPTPKSSSPTSFTLWKGHKIGFVYKAVWDLFHPSQFTANYKTNHVASTGELDREMKHQYSFYFFSVPQFFFL